MNIFQSIPVRRPPSSDFNLSHNRKFACNAGIAVPTLCEEILPSDRFNAQASALARMAPMQAPIMHMVDCYNYSFFVPSRLLMKRGTFETFITGGVKGDGKDALGNTIQIPFFIINMRGDGTSSPASINKFTAGFGTENTGNKSLCDFLGCQGSGLNDSNTITLKVNAMPFIAFWKCWNQYFRDQTLHPDYEQLYPNIFDNTGDITAGIYAALNNVTLADRLLFFALPNVCWEKDYFTSALPFAQRGAAVTTPLTGTGTVTYKTPAIVRNNAGVVSNVNGLLGTTLGSAPNGRLEIDKANQTSAGTQGYLDNIDSVSLTSGGFTINQLRLAVRVQEWLEKMARGGARYIEQIRSHFGVVSSDARLQRVEFLGGGKLPVNISEVLQTSSDQEGEAPDAPTPLGAMAGHGVAAGNVNGFNRFFEEHGFVISIFFIRPRTAYMEGVRRVFRNRFDKLDWPWPSFAHLGEQEVIESELSYIANAVDDTVFGYQSRYAEMKYIPSTVHGEFRTTLNFWHWARIFNGTQPLTKEFVECNPDLRIFNVLDESTAHFYVIVNNRINARRPLPYFGEPAL